MLKGKREAQVENASYKLKQVIRKLVPDIPVLGPSPAAILWMNKYFHWEVLLKLPVNRGGKFNEKLLEKIMEVYEYESQISNAVVRININVGAIR